MRTIEADCRLSALTQLPGIESLLKTLTNQLVQCQNTLEQYMEEKRGAFPRLFFLSDDDLLELLGQTRYASQNRETVMKAHIRKLFPGAAGVSLGPDSVCITAIVGHHGERLTLDTAVDVDVPIEKWLRQLEIEMRRSVHTSVKKCLAHFDSGIDGLLSYPTQCLCLVQSVRLTEKIERSIAAHNLHDLKDHIRAELDTYLKRDARDKESPLEKHKLEALILQCHHYLEIVNELIETNVPSSDHWSWKKQLRFYIENDDIFAAIGLAKLPYTYEYLGTNIGSLVRTKLTDQCFLILTQALHLGLAGNPFGPAGTGKTESVKALGGLLGRLVLVFNCDEGMDKITMGRLLSGLALSGAWGCFDEFNRLNETTLCDMAQQFGSLLEAVGSTSRSTTATLNNKELTVASGCGVFVTMNPAGANYGGRRTLPESINRLLRPCAMWRPCTADIASALLATHGYAEPRGLAEKIVVCFEMAENLLTKSHHYDWGLRALKTIIGSCGSIMKEYAAKYAKFPDRSEQLMMVSEALKLNTLSKLNFEDCKLFQNIMNGIFSEGDKNGIVSNELYENLKCVCEENNLIVNEKQLHKCIELYNQLKQRMGVVVVGPPRSGKTSLYTLLKQALVKSGATVSAHTICPKAMGRSDLLGFIDNDTRQWCDGVISSVGLRIAAQSSDVWSWVVCDGDIDPEWIESLNSVLDDNRLLTLPSGWRIQFGNNVNFIFETHDLSHASPATITRMGIILLSEEESCYEEVIRTSMKHFETFNFEKTTAEMFVDDVFKKVLDWFSSNRNEFVVTYQNNSLINQIFSFVGYNNVGNRSIEDIISSALFKGMSCFIKLDALNDLAEQISQWTGVSSHALLWSADSKNMDSSSLGSASFSDDAMYVSNRITEFLELVQPWIESNQHFIVYGPSASGKSMILHRLLQSVQNARVVNLQCTPILEISHVIQALKQNSALKSGVGASHQRIIIMVKSLHRTKLDEWKSSEIQSFFLQLIHHGGFWQRDKSPGSEGMHWFQLKKFLLIFTANNDDPNAEVYGRLNNSLRVAYLREPDKKELSEICNISLTNTFDHLKIKTEDQKRLTDLNTKMFSFYNEVIEAFSNEIHYKWCIRDMTQWCKSLHYYKITDYDSICHALREEAVITFKDRLISAEEENTLDAILKNRLGPTTTVDQTFVANLNSKGLSLESTNTDDWILKVNKLINQCNSETENGSSAFGEYGTEQCEELRRLVTRASRVIGGPCNGLALVGVVGVGRRAAARIAAEHLSAKHASISTPEQFHQQIKNILMACGSESLNTLVVLEEAVASDRTILSMLEALICDGQEKTALSLPFLDQEIDAILSQSKNPNSEPKTYESFLKNVQNHLGFIIIFDSRQHDLKNVFGSFPFLYQRCKLLWLDNWKDNTMKEVVKTIAMESNEFENCKEIVVNEKLFSLHISITQEELTTPLRYMALFNSFRHICSEKKKYLDEKRSKLESGVKALVAAQQEVARLKADAAEQQILLEEKQSLATVALNQIGSTMQSATVHKQDMEALKKNTEIESIKLQDRKREIENELSEVEPIIQEARTAVGDIRPESLNEVRSLRAPPEPVRDVLEAVLRLMGITDTSWHSMKTFLSKRGIKDEIRTFDASNITSDSLAAVEKLTTTRAASFAEKNAKRASVACAPLASWVVANVKYAHVLHKIAPLEAEQRMLSENLAKQEREIQNLSSNLNTVDEKVASLKQQLNEYTKQATEVEIHLSAVQSTVTKAENLVGKLSNEFDRWYENLQNISKEYDEIAFGAALSAGFITYLTSDKEDYRISMVNKWKENFPNRDSEFSVKSYLLAPEEEMKWINFGLPNDPIAIHNGIILHEVLKSPRRGLTPLVIDPNDTVINWLSQLLDKQPNDIILQHDPKFLTILQHAVRFGKILIIKELAYVDDVWSSLLRGIIPSTLQSVNGINPSFRLILFSRDNSLLNRLSMFHKSLISIVNFTPQLQGLTDQLVASAVKQEQPELQARMLEINVKMNHLKLQQEELEDKLLSQLSSGNILHNEPLLESLDHTQKAVSEIGASLKEASKVASSIGKQCEIYKPLASYTASAALAISTLIYKHPLASLSMRTVDGIFLKTIARFRGMEYDQVSKNIIVSLLERVLVALNKEYHSSILLYLMHLIYPNEIQKTEWEVLLCNIENYLKMDSHTFKDLPRWISQERIPYVYALQEHLPEWFSSLRLEDEAAWSKFAQSGDWTSFPTSIKLTSFQKVLLTWALKPAKFNVTLSKAISSILGTTQLFPVGDLITAVERWGSLKQPTLVVGAAGTNPIDQIKARAASIVGVNNYKQIWLSEVSAQQRAQTLTESIEWVRKSSGWLLIVAASGDWTQSDMYRMLHEISSLPPDADDSNARIWIVMESATSVPYLLTSCCTNVVMEAPTGVKNNLLRILSVWAPQQQQQQNELLLPHRRQNDDPKKVRTEFSLALAHSIIQERCAYIPQGWRYDYGFSWGDADVGLMAVRTVNRTEAGGLCDALYGGRVYWEQDVRLLATIFARHFDESVIGHAWKPLGMDVALPLTASLQDYIPILSKFPNYDDPALLSLPQNIQVAQEQQKGNDIIIQLKSLICGQVIQDLNKKAVKKKLSPILSLWKKLNSGPDSLIKTKLSPIKSENVNGGWKSLVIREWKTAVSGIQSIHHDLASLHSSASIGDGADRGIAIDLITDKTPERWLRLWSGGGQSASAFVAGFCERAAAARRRAKTTTSEFVSGSRVHLSSFYEPGCLFYAFLWESAERLRAPAEELQLVSKWGDEDVDASKIILLNLWIEGALWDGGRLQPCRPETPSRTKAPPISIEFVSREKFSKNDSKNELLIPIFTCDKRKSIIFRINAPAADQFNKNIWLLNSTALII